VPRSHVVAETKSRHRCPGRAPAAADRPSIRPQPMARRAAEAGNRQTNHRPFGIAGISPGRNAGERQHFAGVGSASPACGYIRHAHRPGDLRVRHPSAASSTIRGRFDRPDGSRRFSQPLTVDNPSRNCPGCIPRLACQFTVLWMPLWTTMCAAQRPPPGNSPEIPSFGAQADGPTWRFRSSSAA
jgi:hypothetical protein